MHITKKVSGSEGRSPKTQLLHVRAGLILTPGS